MGSDFTAADPDYIGVPGPEVTGASPACSCGPRGCTPAGPVDKNEPAVAADFSPLEPPQPMLLCPTCDEPFVPEYSRRCLHCGQQFQSGFEVNASGESGDYASGFDLRLAAVMAAILALLAAIGGWLYHLFH